MAIDVVRVKLSLTGTLPRGGARTAGRGGVFFFDGNTIYMRVQTNTQTGFIKSIDVGDTWEASISSAALAGNSWELAVDVPNMTIWGYRTIDVGSFGEFEQRKYDFGSAFWDVVADDPFLDEPAGGFGIVDSGLFEALHHNSTAGVHDLYRGTGDTSIFTDATAEYGDINGTAWGREFDENGKSHIFVHVSGGTSRQFGGADLLTFYHLHNIDGAYSSPIPVKDDSGSFSDVHDALGTYLVSGGDGNMYFPMIAEDSGGTQRLYLCTFDIVAKTWSNELVDADFFSDSTGSIGCHVDSTGAVYILIVGQITSISSNAQVYIFKKPSGSSWERARIDNGGSEVDISSMTISNGRRDGVNFTGAFWALYGDWDTLSTNETFFVKADLQLEDPGEDGSTEEDSVEVQPSFPEVPRRQRIPFDIPTTDARVLQPPPKLSGGMGQLSEWLQHVYDYTRFSIDDHSSRITQLAESLPGSRQDEFDFVAPGTLEEEVAIVHGLGYEPRNLVVISSSDPGTVSLSRDKLGDSNTFFVRCTQVAGARVRVRVY